MVSPAVHVLLASILLKALLHAPRVQLANIVPLLPVTHLNVLQGHTLLMVLVSARTVLLAPTRAPRGRHLAPTALLATPAPVALLRAWSVTRASTLPVRNPRLAPLASPASTPAVRRQRAAPHVPPARAPRTEPGAAAPVLQASMRPLVTPTSASLARRDTTRELALQAAPPVLRASTRESAVRPGAVPALPAPSLAQARPLVLPVLRASTAATCPRAAIALRARTQVLAPSRARSAQLALPVPRVLAIVINALSVPTRRAE